MTLKIKYNLQKYLLVLFMIFSLPLMCLADGSAPALFEKANGLFAKAKYKEAIASYQQIVSEGYQSSAVYFDLGNAYYKSGDIPSALLYYEKAHKIAPGDEDINFNIRFVNSKTADKIEDAPQFFITAWWNAVMLAFSLHALAIISVLLFITGFAALIYYLFTRSAVLKRSSFYTGLASIFFGFIVLFIANRQAHYFDSHHQAIVFGNTVKVKSEPTDNAKDLFIIHEGTKVDINASQDTWTKISLTNGNTGWIRSADVKEI